jgi:hypothetical protein
MFKLQWRIAYTDGNERKDIVVTIEEETVTAALQKFSEKMHDIPGTITQSELVEVLDLGSVLVPENA